MNDHDKMEALGSIIERLEAAWIPPGLIRSTDLHVYEPMRADQFLDDLAVAMEFASGMRYLEIGSGIGTKLVLAEQMGLEVHGIELIEPYIAISQYLCPGASVEIADARYYTGYGAFDIIHCYKPVTSFEALAKLDEHIVQWMKPGAILIHPYWAPNVSGLHRVAISKRPDVWVRD